jgi:urease accessory protein
MENSHGADRKWKAGLYLSFAAERGRSVLKEMAFNGPLRVQRPFYPEGAGDGRYAEPAHGYILHPPGGLVSGDELEIKITAGAGAHALLTTPSAGKAYKADAFSVPQRQRVRLRLEDGAVEWLPRETIVFSGANADLSLDVEMNGGSSFIGWEILILGRRAGAKPFDAGRARQRFRLERDAVPLIFDQLAFDAGDALARGAFGLDGRTVLMSFWAVGGDGGGDAIREAAEALKDRLAETPAAKDTRGGAAASCGSGFLLMRYLGDSGRAARELGLLAWKTVRPVLLKREIHPPRIWEA